MSRPVLRRRFNPYRQNREIEVSQPYLLEIQKASHSSPKSMSTTYFAYGQCRGYPTRPKSIQNWYTINEILILSDSKRFHFLILLSFRHFVILDNPWIFNPMIFPDFLIKWLNENYPKKHVLIKPDNIPLPIVCRETFSDKVSKLNLWIRFLTLKTVIWLVEKVVKTPTVIREWPLLADAKLVKILGIGFF